MKNIKLKDVLIPTVSLFVICLIVSALLAVTNALTKDPIKKNEEEKAQLAMQSVCSFAVDFKAVEGIEAEAYEALDESGKVVGFAIPVSAKGYGGDVSVMVGIGLEGETAMGQVTGVEILSHDETPGLGANATNESFRNEYKQDITADGFGTVKDGSGGSDGKVDALTGATITSNAVTNAVNSAIEIFESIAGGEG